MSKIGITDYGVYVPLYRIKAEEFTKAWGYFGAPGVSEKGVCGSDEDSTTMAIEASLNCVKDAEIASEKIGAVFLASTSLPYDETTMAVTIANVIDAPTQTRTVDFKDSSRSGLSAMLAAFDFIESNPKVLALVTSSDSPLARPDSALDHSLGAGSSAYLIGQEPELASFEGSYSVQSNYLGTRFRKKGQQEIETTMIVEYERRDYIGTSSLAAQGLLEKLQLKVDDFDYIVPHQSDARTPFRVLRKMKGDSSKATIVANMLGDVGSASVMLGLSMALEKAKSGERILLISHGPGSGSDAVSLIVNDGISKLNERKRKLGDYLENREYIDYVTYLKLRGMIT